MIGSLLSCIPYVMDERRKFLSTREAQELHYAIASQVFSSLGVKLGVTENQCVLFNPSSYVYLALLPQH